MPLSAQPGFSPMDVTKVDKSAQDKNLKPHPTPPIAPSADKLPVDKIKLPSGFKAEVWSSGHPGGRTMVMGDGLFTLSGRAAWAHNFDTARNVAATFQALPGTGFLVNGAAMASDAALVSAGTEIAWRNGWRTIRQCIA